MLKHLQSSEEWNDKGALQKGFTLVELLVVIVILGILAAVVVFAVNGISGRGEDSACSTDASTVRTAVEAYRANGTTHTSAKPDIATLATAGLLSKPTQDVVINYTSNDPTVLTFTIDGVAGTTCAGKTNL